MKDEESPSPVPILGQGPTAWQKRRARKEARSMARAARRSMARHGHRLSRAVRDEIAAVAARLDLDAEKGDHDALCDGMVKLDELEHKNLAFARKSPLREYADSIGVAVLVALLLRAFVVEAFKIPSGSMIPTLDVGDHIFVNKFIYGLRIPFTRVKFFEWRRPAKGEVIVFIYPIDPDKDFIKRIVGVEGDHIEVRKDLLYVNGQPVAQGRLPGLWNYYDLIDERNSTWDEKVGIRIGEQLGGESYITIHEPHPVYRGDFPAERLFESNPGLCSDRPDWCVVDDGGAYVVPKDTVFVLGDNRNNSHDSRFWGPVPLENIKGKAMVVWWSSGGPDGVRWDRLGHLVE